MLCIGRGLPRPLFRFISELRAGCASRKRASASGGGRMMVLVVLPVMALLPVFLVVMMVVMVRRLRDGTFREHGVGCAERRLAGLRQRSGDGGIGVGETAPEPVGGGARVVEDRLAQRRLEFFIA